MRAPDPPTPWLPEDMRYLKGAAVGPTDSMIADPNPGISGDSYFGATSRTIGSQSSATNNDSNLDSMSIRYSNGVDSNEGTITGNIVVDRTGGGTILDTAHVVEDPASAYVVKDYSSPPKMQIRRIVAAIFLLGLSFTNATHAHSHAGVHAHAHDLATATTNNAALTNDLAPHKYPPLSLRRHRSLQTETVWAQMGQTINGFEAGDHSGWDVAISDDGTRVVVASPFHRSAFASQAGSVRVFEYGTSVANQWTSIGLIEGNVAQAQQGHSVSMSGDGSTIAVGAINLEPFKGYVRIYRLIGGAWSRLTQIDGSVDRDRFGEAVSLNFDGTRVAVGTFYHDTFRGETQIWEQGASDTDWVSIGQIQGQLAGDRSGHSVALSGDGSTVAIGEISSDPNGLANAGSVTVWQRTSSLEGWTAMGGIIPGTSAGEQTGYDVAISFDGLTVAVGSPLHSSQANMAGMARVFTYDGTTWNQKGPDIFPEAPADSVKFGHSISLSSDGSILLVGQPTEKWIGKASVYQYNSQDVTPSYVLDTTVTGGNFILGRFGSAVALSGDGKNMIVGEYLADGAGQDSGASYVYQFQTSDWVLSVTDFQSDFGSGDDPEFTLTFSGVAPTARAGRTYRTEILIAGCSLGAASDDAISFDAPTGSIPNAATYNIATSLSVDKESITSSGFFVDKGLGMGELAFCVKMEILEGSTSRALEGETVKAERLVDITVQLDMTQDFLVTDFVSRNGATGKTDIREDVQFNYGFTTYFCDEFGNNIEGSNSNTVVPGGVVSLCLEADEGEGVKVVDVKDVSFGNSQAPLLGGVEIIDSNGLSLADSTKKECDSEAGKCRIEAVTVPRLYEYVDSSGNVVNVASGANMNGLVVFGFSDARRERVRGLRHLQQQSNTYSNPTSLEARFRVELNLASPPDRTNGSSSAPPTASVRGITAAMLCLGVVAVFWW